jgi:hypothetical protein
VLLLSPRIVFRLLFALKRIRSMIVDVGQGSVRHCAAQSLGCANKWRKAMCDFSLHAVASRPAKVGETLVARVIQLPVETASTPPAKLEMTP